MYILMLEVLKYAMLGDPTQDYILHIRYLEAELWLFFVSPLLLADVTQIIKYLRRENYKVRIFVTEHDILGDIIWGRKMS